MVRPCFLAILAGFVEVVSISSFNHKNVILHDELIFCRWSNNQQSEDVWC
jgi:hypothetical protein